LSYECTAGEEKIFCIIGNPMSSGVEATFQLTLGPADLQQSIDECQVTIVANR